MSAAADKWDIGTTSELRRFLINQMKGVASGDTDPTRAKVVCNLSQQVYNTLRIEVAVATAALKLGPDGEGIKPLKV